MRGKLVFYGAPQEALAHVKAESFKDLYDKLEDPVDQQLAALPPLPPNAAKLQKAAREAAARTDLRAGSRRLETEISEDRAVPAQRG